MGSDSSHGLRLEPPRTRGSRRTLALPPIAVEVPRKYRKEQAKAKLAVGKLYGDQGLVFTDDAARRSSGSRRRSAGALGRGHDQQEAD